jgi:YD repeat-containing protein
VDGLKYRYTFDELDRLVETDVKEAAGGAPFKPLSRTTYDPDTIPHWMKTTELDEFGVAQKVETKDYDGIGNVMRIWKTIPGSSSAYQRQDFLYALNGKMIKSSYPTAAGVLDSLANLDFTKTLYEGYFDWRGEARETYADKYKGLGQQRFPQAQTWEKKTEDALGYTKRLVLNPLGLPTQVYETKGAIAETKTADYEFDAQGRLTKLTFPNTNAYGYVYDTAGRLRTVNTGTGGVANNIWQTYLYDGIRYHKRTDSAGLWHEVPITGGYDALDRVIQFKVSDPVTTTATYTAVYNDVASTGTARGKLAAISDPAGGTASQTFAYDSFGRLVSTTRQWLAGAKPKTFKYTYDFQGRLQDETFPSGTVVSHAYEQGLETSLHIVPNGGAAPYNIFQHYDSANGLLSQVNAPATELIVDFDRTFSPTRIERHKYEIDGIMNRRDFTWAANGQLNAIDYSGAYVANHAFTYDALSRLLTFAVGNATKASYAYDASGDLTQGFSLTPSAGTYNYVLSSDSKGVTKPSSRTKAGTTETFLYDAAHRLTTWNTSGGPQRTFSYDGLGRIREAKLGGGQKQSFQYDFNGALIETEAINGAATEYVQQFSKWHNDETVKPAKETETLHAVLDVENGVRHWKLTELFGTDVSREYLTLPSSQAVNPAAPRCRRSRPSTRCRCSSERFFRSERSAS